MKLLPVSIILAAAVIGITYTLTLSPSKTDQSQENQIGNHIHTETETEHNYVSFQSLENKELTPDDQETYEALKKNIKLSYQVSTELDFLLKELQTTDELEGALEAMEIAYKENSTLLQDIHLRFDPHDHVLLELKESYTSIITQYIEGLRFQLNAIEHGNTEKMNNGQELLDKSKKELTNLSTALKTT
ncbi:hypothetical protein [Bacillus sp. PS06]|uniref:hypothetical protein n=1 Tax=Bacillus sp. PS06 TaxID=2764176 RepID=UPI001782737B|nr:hypothetical protein [Bacillus sp. PS06]MBD8070515.1 hypothetical protein [Bacillus sp. PS06]